ncbi:MAG: hypothetical protein JRH20_22545 [Deltaproteobacteria bacterium]|nr:hypothetical protein [Deltaproteobacteria bacterium]
MKSQLLTLAATAAILAAFSPATSHADLLTRANPLLTSYSPKLVPWGGPTGTITVKSADWIESDGWVYATAEVDDNEDGDNLSLEWSTNAGGISTHLTACSNKKSCFSTLPMPLQCREGHYLTLRITDSSNKTAVVESSLFSVYDVTCAGEIDSAPECARPNADIVASDFHPTAIMVRNSAKWAEAGPTWVRFAQNARVFESVVGPMAPGEGYLVYLPSNMDRNSPITVDVDSKHQIDELYTEYATGCVTPGATASYDGEANNRLILPVVP